MPAENVKSRWQPAASYDMSYDTATYLYDTAGCQNDTAGCQNDAAKPHFEGSQDTWMHGFLHVCLELPFLSS